MFSLFITFKTSSRTLQAMTKLTTVVQKGRLSCHQDHQHHSVVPGGLHYLIKIGHIK